MILDKQNLFSEGQDAYTTGYSANSIDLGSDAPGKGGTVNVFCVVAADYAGGTSLTPSLETADNADFNGAATISTAETALTAALKAGYSFGFGALPQTAKRYVRMKYTVAGEMTEGAVTSGLVLDKQTNR